MDDTSDRRQFYILFALFAALRLIAFIFSRNYDGDAILRVWIGTKWLENPFFIYHANPVTWVFGPLHFYLIGLALAIRDNILYSPRVVNLILGVLSFLPFWGIMNMKFGRRAAVYGSFLFAFFTLHVKYSTVATSEAIFTFALLCALYFFFKSDYGRRMKWLMASALFMNMAAMTRHETPLFTLVLAAMIFFNIRGEGWGRRIGATLAFIALSSVFTAIWYWGDYVHHGSPLYSVLTAGGEHGRGIQYNLETRGVSGNLIYNLAFWPGVLLLSLTPLAALLALVGLLRSYRDRAAVVFALMFLAPYLSYNYQAIVGGTLMPLARFAAVFALFLPPLAALEWDWIGRRLTPARGKLFDLAIGATVVVTFIGLAYFGVEGKGAITDKLSSVSPLSRLPVYVDDVLNWTNEHIAENEKIVWDSHGLESDVMAFYSKIPKDNIKIRWHDRAEISAYIQDARPAYMVYSPDGKLPALFKSPEDSSLAAYGFMPVPKYQTDHYIIYKLEYPASDSLPQERPVPELQVNQGP